MGSDPTLPLALVGYLGVLLPEVDLRPTLPLPLVRVTLVYSFQGNMLSLGAVPGEVRARVRVRGEGEGEVRGPARDVLVRKPAWLLGVRARAREARTWWGEGRGTGTGRVGSG